MKTKLKILLLFIIITAMSLGCIDSKKSPAANETESKTLELVDMGISLPEKNLSIGEKVSVFFDFTPHENVTRAIANINTEGAVVLTGQSNFSWEKLSANIERRSESTIQILKPGLGTLTSTITIENETGQTVYGRSAIVYFFVSQREVYVGQISFETRPLKINGTFETWSKGYWSNYTYNKTYFRVITNYSVWGAVKKFGVEEEFIIYR